MPSMDTESEEVKGQERDWVTDGDTWQTIDGADVEIGEQIGGGGVGLIYRGWLHDKPVALKTLFDPRQDAELKKDYIDELHVMSQLDHPNIVRCLGACMTPPKMFFVMELCESSLFDDLHKHRRMFSTHELVQMAVDVAEAINYLHLLSPPIIHRDVKSHNVLIAKGGVLKLCDFGLVRTRSVTAGTPAYMSPELLANKPFTRAVDIYAFGMLLWELFTQEIPYYGLEVYDDQPVSVADIRDVVMSGERPSIPRGECPVAIRELIRDCWDADPSARPTAKTLIEELRIVLEELPGKTNLEMLDHSLGGGDCLDDLLLG